MRIATTQRGDVTVLEVSGELTWDSAPRFPETTAVAFKEGRRDFIVDLHHVETLDSAGLEAFTALQRQCEEQLGMVRFCNLTPDVQKIFELTRLDQVLTIQDGIEEALGSFAIAQSQSRNAKDGRRQVGDWKREVKRAVLETQSEK